MSKHRAKDLIAVISKRDIDDAANKIDSVLTTLEESHISCLVHKVCMRVTLDSQTIEAMKNDLSVALEICSEYHLKM